MGYPLAPTQGELTFLQKLFLSLAYPEFREMQRKASENPGKNKTSPSEEEEFKRRYRAKQLENKRKHEEQIKKRVN